MTNNTFSFNRFGNYFRLYMAQHGRLFVQCVLAGYVIFSLIFTIICSLLCSNTKPTYTDGLVYSINSTTSAIMLVALIPLMCLVGSHIMHAMSNRRRRLHTLAMPASALEKYLSFWIIHVALFFIAYFCVVYSADATRTVLCKLFYPELAEYITLAKGNDYFAIAPRDLLGLALLPLLFIQSYFVMGSTVWNRFSFFKTLGFGIIGVLLLIFSFSILTSKFDVKIRVDVIPYYTQYITLIPAIFNWYMGYRRFKEAELVPQI